MLDSGEEDVQLLAFGADRGGAEVGVAGDRSGMVIQCLIIIFSFQNNPKEMEGPKGLIYNNVICFFFVLKRPLGYYKMT